MNGPGDERPEGQRDKGAGDADFDQSFSAEALAAGDRLMLQPWAFLKGVVSLDALPPADRPEVAFAGRSNVGKSSLINALLKRHGLARTSNTPGRTQELNVFVPMGGGPDCYLFDLPGYGFAKAPKDKVDAWTRLVTDYLRGRPNLSRVFLLIDSRHGLKPVDREIMAMLDQAAVTYQAVLTKGDKLNLYKLEAVRAATEQELAKHPAAFPLVLATSSEKGSGLGALRATIAEIVAAAT